jgi:cell division protein ZapE
LSKNAESEVSLICFVEFQVVDIADAMLLGRIFEFIFRKEIFVVFTSNSHPQDLYKNGLQRQLFLEFINKILLKKIKVIEVNNNIDYRSIFRKNIEKRYFIANIAQSRTFWNIVSKAVDSKKLITKDLTIWGRKITINKSYGNIAIIDFKDIIEQNFGADDYRAICYNFSLIFFINLPKLNAQQVNEARRLTLFIDEIYQNRVAMIILAKTKPDKLYLQGIGFESFKRTISRLKEIQSDYYWQNSKLYDSQ